MWLGQHTGIRTRGITAIALDPANPELMYAGTLSEGLFKTVDGGATWLRTGADFGALEVYSLAIGYGSPAALYAATSYGLLRSNDGGESWTTRQAPGWVSILAVAPGEPSTIYAGSEYSSGVMKSTDDGQTDASGNRSTSTVTVAVPR